MNILRKYFIFFISFIILLTGCTSKNEEKKFYLDGNGNEIEVTYLLKDDIVIEQKTISKLLYKHLNVKNAEEAEKLMKPFYEPYNNISGLKHEVKYNDDDLIENSKIDFTKLDKHSLSEVGVLFGDVDTSMSISEITKIMKEIGFSEKKKSPGEILNIELENEMNLYSKLVEDFNKTSIEELTNKKDKYLLFVGFKECPYCRLFVPKLHTAVTNNTSDIFYLDTTTIKDTKIENEFIKMLNLEAVPALYIIEKENIKKFEFKSSEDVEIKEISNFIDANF